VVPGQRRPGLPAKPGDDVEDAGRRPASYSTSTKAAVDAGECSDGLATQVHPAASSGASFQVSSSSGLFHGVIAATTPTGSRSVQPK
jgi:hypothetical protein